MKKKLLLPLLCLIATGSFAQNSNPVLLPLFIDYKAYQSPVKNQVNRGTCLAFSVAAVMETFDGVPADLSEQAAYGAIKLKEFGTGQITGGGLLADYPGYLVSNGFMYEALMPYNPKAGLWSPSDNLLKQYLQEGQTGIAELLKDEGNTRYGVTEGNYIFLKDDQARDVNAIKRLLAQGHKAIAVGYTMLYQPYWSGYMRGVIYPEQGFSYTINNRSYNYFDAKRIDPDLVDNLLNGTHKITQTDKRTDKVYYGGHAVTIIGYTDKGFLIKNSWGKGFGMDGYGVVSFDYHRLFCDEALAISAVNIGNSKADPSVYNPRLYLKTRPQQTGNKKYLRLSLFCPDKGGLSPVNEVNYEVYEQNPNGTRGRLLGMPGPSLFSNNRTAFVMDVLEDQYNAAVVINRKFWIQANYTVGTGGQKRVKVFNNVVCGTNEYRGQ